MPGETNTIPFPTQMGEILGTAARTNGNILAAAREIPIKWEGNRAILVGSEIPTFQTALGQKKVSNEKGNDKVDLTVLTLPSDFRIPVQQVLAAQENGTYNTLIAEHLEDAIALSIKAVEYAMIHGYDLGSGTKLDVIHSVHGCIDNAVGDKAIKSVSPLKDLGNAIQALDDYEATNIFTTPRFYSDIYTDADGKGQIPFNTAFNYIGIDTQKSDVVSAKKVSGAQEDKVIMGDFSKLVWGAKTFGEGISVVTDGNPRGKGELRDTNEIAFIFEVGYAWAVTNTEAFAIIKDSVEG